MNRLVPSLVRPIGLLTFVSGPLPPPSTKLDYLATAKRSDNPIERLHVLQTVISDDDLTSGREELHPDWLTIYESSSESLADVSYGSEIKRALQHLSGFEEAAKLIDPKNRGIVFLLGAGASKPQPSGIPTVTELLPDLLDRGRRLDREDVNRLADFCESSKITNIEDLLTAAQLSEYCGRNPSVLRLIEFLLYRQSRDGTRPGLGRNRVDIGSVAFLQDTLQVLFGLLSSRMLPAKPNAAHEAIASYAREDAATTIITTNYDCCMTLRLGQMARILITG